MKILCISAMALKTNAGGYSGLERALAQEAQGLAEMGHDVTLIAAKGSVAPKGVALVETVPSWDALTPQQQQAYAQKDGVERDWGGQKWLARTFNAWRAHEQEAFGFYDSVISDYDVVLDASWSKWSYTSKKDEVVGVCHSIKPYNSAPPREYPLLCGVSRGHARFLTAQLQRPVRVVWNPVNVEEFTVTREKADRVLSLNRIMPAKGIHLFLDVIEKEKVKADVVGDDSTLVPDQGYVNFIKERCKSSAYAAYHGLVNDGTRNQFLQRSKVLVCMKDGGYEEVFGLNVSEAHACGMPVIALRSWGFEDQIVHDKTGMLCDSVEQVADYVRMTMNGDVKFDPDECRKGAEVFSRAKVCRSLEQMLEAVHRGSRW